MTARAYEQGCDKRPTTQRRTVRPAVTAAHRIDREARLSSDLHTSGAARAQARGRRRTLELLGLCALVLIVWTVLLGLSLPSDYRVHAWRTTWVGFNLMLLTSLITTAVLAWRRSRAAAICGLVTAVLLICDAWFDVSLDLGTASAWESVALAVLIEVPLAVLIFHRVYKAFTRAEPSSGKKSWFS